LRANRLSEYALAVKAIPNPVTAIVETAIMMRLPSATISAEGAAKSIPPA
jgi:hypothetical protein